MSASRACRWSRRRRKRRRRSGARWRSLDCCEQTSMTTKVVFLGGIGEIGRNMLAVESAGQILVIDCGLSFPNEDMLGVDLVLPDFSYVRDRQRDCVGVVLTHGHE